VRSSLTRLRKQRDFQGHVVRVPRRQRGLGDLGGQRRRLPLAGMAPRGVGDRALPQRVGRVFSGARLRRRISSASSNGYTRCTEPPEVSAVLGEPAERVIRPDDRPPRCCCRPDRGRRRRSTWGGWYCRRSRGGPLSRPPASSAAEYTASTVARSAQVKATCVPVPTGSRSETQKSRLSDRPNPARFRSLNAITTRYPSGASARS
jgi:hypothetical protein